MDNDEDNLEEHCGMRRKINKMCTFVYHSNPCKDKVGNQDKEGEEGNHINLKPKDPIGQSWNLCFH